MARATAGRRQPGGGLPFVGGSRRHSRSPTGLQDLAVYGTARNPLDAEIVHQLNLVIETASPLDLALGRYKV
jgi:hypothetical protein